MYKKIFRVFLIVGFVLSFFTFLPGVHGQTLDCSNPANRETCLAELAKTEQEITNLNAQLEAKRREGASIKRDKDIIDLQIQSAKLKIRQHDLAIAKLGKEIETKNNSISALTDRISKGRSSIGEMIAKTNELDEYSIVEVMLSNKNLSDFFVDIDSFASIQDSMRTELEGIRKAKKETEEAKKELSEKRNEEIDTKQDAEAQKRLVEKAEAEKRRLLSINNDEQKSYQAVIADKQAKAAKIRNSLFQLRDAASIKFGDAVVLAKRASEKTGVRAALILGVIQQESNLGQNVGSCYLSSERGNGVRISNNQAVSNVMKPGRDVEPFMSITSELGRDPFKTRVSCPYQVGYGGAMGPAQFIPSTWMSMRGKVASLLGKGAADPWNPEDAFMASASYLSELGARSGSYTAERNAACRYYSGRACSGSNSFYGNQVMSKASAIQENIEFIQNN